jgi:NAD(P)-dependent dehydrogenase (short-subunit alcohol dehydrogenase family)
MGIYEAKEFFEISDEDWFRFFEVNVMSGIRLSKIFMPAMLKNNWGRIVFISSESAVNIPREMIHYGFTKTSQLAISRGLAELTVGTGVTVNTVLPGPTRSEGVDQFVAQMAKQKSITSEEVEKDFFKTIRPSSLIQRFATCEEVAAMVVYVCSESASATNGASLRVEGGLLRSII